MNPSKYTITIPSVLSFGLFTDCVKDSVSSAINYLENAQVVDEIALIVFSAVTIYQTICGKRNIADF